MASFSDELINSSEQIVERWYETWSRSSHPHRDVSEKLLKDSLAAQFRLIGEQLKNLSTAEAPELMWKLVSRLDPEARIAQKILIEEVVQQYRIAVDVVRSWVQERGVNVEFAEYSYFYRALFELTAEAVRRYSAEQANIVSGERARYLANLAHQMRGPLSSFSVLIDQVKRSASSGTPVIDETVVHISERNLKRLVSLIDNVLKLERFKPEELTVRPQLLCPAQIIQEVISDNSHDAEAKGLHLVNAVDPALKMQIDPDLFHDAISNLVQNAVKYTTAGSVRVESREQHCGIIFEVIDSGPGVSAAQETTLFRTVQPGEGGGIGIGLLIVHRAVTAQGGTVGVKSKPGEGSIFWFCLPRIVRAREVTN
jgi:two-component system, OmpR family, sensor histidine kinase SenX3